MDSSVCDFLSSPTNPVRTLEIWTEKDKGNALCIGLSLFTKRKVWNQAGWNNAEEILREECLVLPQEKERRTSFSIFLFLTEGILLHHQIKESVDSSQSLSVHPHASFLLLFHHCTRNTPGNITVVMHITAEAAVVWVLKYLMILKLCFI